MIFIIQFPFANSRNFLSQETNQLANPTWPFPIPRKEFIRFSGVIEERRKGGVEGWSSEEIYCNAKNALRFPSRLSKQPVGSLGESVSMYSVFRRFLHDGEAVSRVEVGLGVRKGKRSNDPLSLTERDVLELIKTILSLEVRMSLDKDALVNAKLVDCGPYLAKHYLNATTRLIKGEPSSIESWWFTSGTPLILVKYFEDEILALPKSARWLSLYPDFEGSLEIDRIELSSKRINIWYLGVNSYMRRYDTSAIRRLRLHLFRLHAERECLKQILRLIISGKIQPKARSQASDRLQSYLSDAMNLLTRKQFYGRQQTKILKAAQRCEDIITPGERTTLLRQLSKINIRKNIYNDIATFTTATENSQGKIVVIGEGNTIYFAEEQKIGGETVTNYNIKIGKNVTFHRDFVVANTIQNSFNAVSLSDASDDLKEKLGKLSEAVAEMCKHLPEEEARETARDLESFSKETVSKKPRRKWYELSAEGLIKAARTVGKVAAPVIATVKAIISMLA